MIDTLLDPLRYDYMVNAMLVSAMIGGVCAALSCFITLRGWSLMGDALAHAVVPGVTLAWLAGLPFAPGAFAAGLLAALCMHVVKTRTRLREDAVIGIVFTTFFAAGALMISRNPSGVRLTTIVMGNILGITRADMLQMTLLALLVALVLALKWKDFMLLLFDAGQAQVAGLRVQALRVILLTLLAATAVAALQAVGACLTVAMLVTPGSTAYLLTDRFGRMLLLAVGIGALGAVAGVYASFFLDVSAGGCIVVLQTLIFLTVLVLAPRHGLLAARRARAAEARAEEAPA